MNFTETPVCTSRTNCFHCRNNEQFRAQMEQQYGKWECPDNIPLGVKAEDLPEKAREAYKQMMEVHEKRMKQIEEVKVALNELEMIVPPEANPVAG